MTRPRSVTLLAIGVLSFTGLGFIRLVQTIRLWDFLASLPLSVPPLYLALSGMIGGLVSGVLSWGLWTGRPWAPTTARAVVLAYAGFFWVERLYLAWRGTNLGSWPFQLGMTLALIAMIFWILARPAAKNFFGEIHER